jgi:lipoprotein-releasing system ATP-binding protein
MSHMDSFILDARNITKSFSQPDKSTLVVLQHLSLKVNRGTIVAITGASGSGKSTLLHLVGNLDTPDSGVVLFSGENIYDFSVQRKSTYRNQQIGFLYQFHYLMPELNVLENVAFPYLINDFNRDEAFDRAQLLLAEVGLKDKSLNMSYQLSGGERQRVAIARSLVNSPELLLADEPTGNLDWKTGERVFDLFKRMIAERQLTAIVATHNEHLAQMMDVCYHLQAGKLA